MTIDQLTALATEKIRTFVEIDSNENGIDSTSFQLRKRYLPELSEHEADDLVYFLVFGTDRNFRRLDS